MQPSALMLPNCQWRAFDGAPFAIDQDIWRIQNPLSVCDIGNASSHQFLARSSVLATARPHLVTFISRKASIVSPGTRTIRPVARLGRIRPKTTGKRLQGSERNKDQITSLALDTAYTKKIQVVLSARLRRASHRRLESRHCRQSRKELGCSQDRQVPLWSRRPIAASEDLVGPPTFPLKSKLFLPQRLHSPCLQHWVLYAETTRPPPALGSPALFITTAIPYLPPTEGYVAKPPHHAIQSRNDRSTLQSIVLESPKITIENIYSDEEHSERGATGKTTREPIG